METIKFQSTLTSRMAAFSFWLYANVGTNVILKFQKISLHRKDLILSAITAMSMSEKTWSIGKQVCTVQSGKFLAQLSNRIILCVCMWNLRVCSFCSLLFCISCLSFHMLFYVFCILFYYVYMVTILVTIAPYHSSNVFCRFIWHIWLCCPREITIIKCCESFTRWLLDTNTSRRKTNVIVFPKSSNKFNYNRWDFRAPQPHQCVPSIQPAFIEWQSTIHRALPPPKILG